MCAKGCKVCFLSLDDHQTKDGRTVLLSSSLGISRSVTVALAYYMWNKKVSLKVILDKFRIVGSCPPTSSLS